MLSRISEHPYFKHTQEQIEASRRWVEENPELAKAWDEALDMDLEVSHQAREIRLTKATHAAMPEALRACDVPGRCADVLLDANEETPAFAAVKRFLQTETTFCLLMGAAGAGKSVAASWAVWMEVWPEVRRTLDFPYRRRFSARFMRAGDMARMSAYGYEAEREFEAMCCAQVFILDDMGTERPSDTWLALLDELIDRRYGDRLKTVLTTNLDAEAFKKRYGERISDRIRHDGVVVGAGANSLRARP